MATAKRSQAKKKGKGERVILEFWGVRGSIPTPGTPTAKVGGNTACVELRAGNDRVIFDAGTGLRELGMGLGREQNLHLAILLSHYHWDHLLGLPFFIPIFKPDATLYVYGEEKEHGGPREALMRQFAAPSFPVEFSTLGSKLEFHNTHPGETFNVGKIVVKVGRLNHPNQAVSYRAEIAGKSVVYASDHEHDGSGDNGLIEFARNADALVYDSMYTDESYKQGKKGWGHSTWQEGVRVAKAAKVKRLFLYHHDPAHDDKTMAAIERRAKKAFKNVIVARERLKIDLGPA